jgi:Na+/pantothenate symporter
MLPGSFGLLVHFAFQEETVTKLKLLIRATHTHISANSNFDHFGQSYNVTRILTSDYQFNETAYQEYSPLFLGPAFSFTYGLSFATLISTVVHVGLFYGTDIWRRAKSANDETPDVHLKLMRRYKEAPEWWFLATFLICFGFGMITSQVWPTHLTWWAYIICILIGTVLILPVGKLSKNGRGLFSR